MGGVSPETCWASYKYGIINFDTLLHLAGYFCMNRTEAFGNQTNNGHWITRTGYRLHTATFFFLWRCDPTRVMAASFLKFLDHTQRRTTVGRTPLDELSAHRRDLYLTTHNTHYRQTSMPPRGIRTHDLSRRAAADLHFRPRNHWDRHTATLDFRNMCYIKQHTQMG